MLLPQPTHLLTNTANERHLEENPSLSTETDQGKVWARKYLLVNYEITIIM